MTPGSVASQPLLSLEHDATTATTMTSSASAIITSSTTSSPVVKMRHKSAASRSSRPESSASSKRLAQIKASPSTESNESGSDPYLLKCGLSGSCTPSTPGDVENAYDPFVDDDHHSDADDDAFLPPNDPNAVHTTNTSQSLTTSDNHPLNQPKESVETVTQLTTPHDSSASVTRASASTSSSPSDNQILIPRIPTSIQKYVVYFDAHLTSFYRLIVSCDNDDLYSCIFCS